MQNTNQHQSQLPSPRRLRAACSFAAGMAATLAAGIAVSTVVASAATPVLTGPVTNASFAAITPCRLMDTRPGDDNVGPRATPITAGETHTQQVTGVNGNCVIPNGVTAIALNATAVRPTATSYLTFFPSDAVMPLSSNLNLAPGQPPTPNKIDVRVSDTGSIGIFNAFGQVDVIVDVMGYYVAEPGPFATTAHHDGGALSGTPASVVHLVVDPPSDGALVVSSSAQLGTLGGGRADCSINDEVAMDEDHRQVWNPSSAQQGSLAGSRTFVVSAGEETMVRLVCRVTSGFIGVNEADLSAIFIPSFVAQSTISAS